MRPTGDVRLALVQAYSAAGGPTSLLFEIGKLLLELRDLTNARLEGIQSHLIGVKAALRDVEARLAP